MLITIGIYIACVIVAKAFVQDVNNSIYWIAGGAFLVPTVSLLDKEWIQDVQIDEVTKTITCHYRSPINGEGEKVHILNNVQLYIKTKPGAPNAQPVIRSLDLYKKRRLILSLHTRTDGFTSETLEAIRRQLLRLGIPEQ